MFFHKSKPLTAGFACAAAAMIIGLAANPAQADRRKTHQQDSYCGERDSCKYPTGGVVQKKRDGVNYFYGGGFHAPSPSLSYIYVINSNVDQPYEVPIRSSNLYTTSFEAPLSKHRFRMKKDHWKWNRRHPGPLELPGLHSRDKFMRP